MDWVFFSLLARAAWSADNIIDKLLREKYLPDSFVLSLLTGVFALILAILIIIFNGLRWIGPAPVVLVMLAGAIQLPAVFAFFQAISKEEVSRVIPLFQFTPPLVLLLSFLFLGETLTPKYYAAFLLILLGGFLISIQKVEKILRLREAFWWMIFSSLIYAVQAVALKSLYTKYSFWDLTVYLGFGEFLPTLVIVAVLAKSRNRFIKSLSSLKSIGWMLLVSAVVLVNIASLSGLWAIATGPVSLVSVMRGFQSLFTLIFAVFLSIWFPKILKEELGKGVLGIKLTAILLMGIGLYFIYF
ncbi:MAG TPA: EamA family transporter [Candidatus Nanoarchaeia archaeon]